MLDKPVAAGPAEQSDRNHLLELLCLLPIVPRPPSPAGDRAEAR